MHIGPEGNQRCLPPALADGQPDVVDGRQEVIKVTVLLSQCTGKETVKDDAIERSQIQDSNLQKKLTCLPLAPKAATM